MAELQKLLESNGAFKSELIQDLLHQTQLSTGGLRASSSTLPIISSSSLVQPSDVNQNISVSASQSVLRLTESTPRNENLNVLDNTSFTGSNTDNDNMNNTRTDSSVTKLESEGPSTSISIEQITHEVTALSVLETTKGKLEICKENENERVTCIISELQKNLSETRKLLVEQVTATVVDAHLSTTINTHANVAEANERSQLTVKDKPDAYPLTLNSNNLWQHFLSAMLPELTKVIKFCTKLPGFSELGQDDQILLVKQGCFEVMVTRFCLLVDPVKQEMFDPTLEIKAPRQIVQETPMGDFLDQFFTVASKFNPLALTDEEIGLFTAVLMLCPDREGLVNQATIKAIHQLFLQSLYWLLKQNHRDADEVIRTLLNIMPTIRKINVDHLKFLQMIKLKSPTEFEEKFPTLHRELFDIAC